MVPRWEAQLVLMLLAAMQPTVLSQARCPAEQVNYEPRVRTWLVNTDSNMLAAFFCNSEDQELRGIGFKVCNNGQWSNADRVPRCVGISDCPRLPSVAQGSFNATYPHRYSDVAKLACDQGYVLVGASLTKCRLRGWSLGPAAIGRCSKMCTLPSVNRPLTYGIQGGLRSANSVSVPTGTKLSFQCSAPANKLKGSPILTCTDNDWSGSIPQCIEQTCSLNSLLSAKTIAARNSFQLPAFRQTYRYGRIIRIRCQIPQDSYLEPADATQFSCSADTRKKDGQVVWTYNGTKKIVTSPIHIACRGYCQIARIANGPGRTHLRSASGKNQVKIGEEVRFNCVDRRQIVPEIFSQAALVCASRGRWKLASNKTKFTGQIGCLATDCRIPSNEHRAIQVIRNSPFVVEPVCAEFYERVGANLSICVLNRSTGDRSWKPDLATCQRKRVVKSPCQSFAVRNGEIISSSTEPFMEGATIGIECDECYRPRGGVVSRCQTLENGTSLWSPDVHPTRCVVRKCSPQLPMVARGGPLQYRLTQGVENEGNTACGTTVEFSCARGFSLIGDNTLHCLPSEKWSGCVPKCIRTQCASEQAHSCSKPARECRSVSVREGTVPVDQCLCVEESQCPQCPESRPVCGSDGQTYESMCHLETRNCAGRGGGLSRNNPGQCLKGGICNQPQPAPPNGTSCATDAVKWYFNSERLQCDTYRHGPCAVGDNSFELETACRRTCLRAPDPCKEQHAVAGGCRDFSTRFSYNQKLRRCSSFQYNGCGGNGNNFLDRKTCEKTCRAKRRPTDSGADRPAANPCQGRPCPLASMREACPVNDTNVFALLGRIGTVAINQLRRKYTYFQVYGVTFLYKPSYLPASTAFRYYALLRLDNGDKRCGCPDLADGNFFIIGRTTQQGYLLADGSSFVQQYKGSAEDFRRRFEVACPHIASSLPER